MINIGTTFLFVEFSEKYSVSNQNIKKLQLFKKGKTLKKL